MEETKNMIVNEFFSEAREIDLGFCYWRKPELYPVGIFEKSPSKLNYFSIKSNDFRKYISPDFFFRKKKYNSYSIQLPSMDRDSIIEELKLTNIKITDWDDVWEDKRGNILDPKISKLNLSHNIIKNISILDPRPNLEKINLSFNPTLVYLNISYASNLSEIDLSYCSSLEYINLSSSFNLKKISLKNCDCSDSCLESLFRNITPHFIGEIDLRGNSINWGNRKISSKIRLLLANNWQIKWDSNPPDSIIPLGYWKKFDPLLLDRNFR